MKLRFVYLTIFLTLLISFSTTISAKDSIVTADDEWISVRSKNFFLVGNAKEKDIRGVAAKLEQFRETFRLLFPSMNLNQTIETNVVVFKNKKSYKPFLPKRGDGKPDEGIAGYFKSGEDLNYITLSTEGGKEDTYGTIFHEYVHFMLNNNFGKSEIPTWFNEGLAEYYQTFEIEDDQKVFLGNLQEGHLYTLQRSQLIPLKTFFAVDGYSLHRNGDQSRGIFYSQAWALIHYLIQTKQSENLSKFLTAVINNIEPEKAFTDAFGSDYETMEKALKKYAKQSKFQISVVTFKNKLNFDTEMVTTQLPESEANAYLGDLLYHMNDYDEAETYLQKSLQLDPNQSMANTSYGLVKMRQRKFDEAKKYLEKAVSANRRNHFAHYNYAYVISRESLDEFGMVSGYPQESAEIMRKSLLEAIKINPNFTESYRLLAFINMVNNEKLDESVTVLKKALSLQPGNEDYLMLIAQTYMRQDKFDDAEKIANKLAASASEQNLRSQAQSLLGSIRTLKENKAQMAKYRNEARNNNEIVERPNLKRKSSLSNEEVEKIELDNKIHSYNEQLQKPEKDQKQIVGYTQKVECLSGGVKYTIKTDEGTLILKSKDFQVLNLLALDEASYDVMVGCNAEMEKYKTVYTYDTQADTKMRSSGNLIGMAFVPEYFRLKTAEEMANTERVIVVDDIEQKKMMLEGIKNAMRKPQIGETRGLGILEKIECNKNQMIFRVKIDGQDLALRTDSPNNVKIMMFTPDAAGMQFGCGVKPPPINVVITYRPTEKSDKKIQGEIVALEYVPESFEL